MKMEIEGTWQRGCLRQTRWDLGIWRFMACAVRMLRIGNRNHWRLKIKGETS